MPATSNALDLITEATAEANIKLSLCKKVEKVVEDLSGNLEGPETLTVVEVEGYYLIDDGADRWLAEADDYNEALETITTQMLDGEISIEDSAPYDALCRESTCLYSKIGTGRHNDDVAGLLEELDGLEDGKIDEIFEFLHIERPAVTRVTYRWDDQTGVEPGWYCEAYVGDTMTMDSQKVAFPVDVDGLTEEELTEELAEAFPGAQVETQHEIV